MRFNAALDRAENDESERLIGRIGAPIAFVGVGPGRDQIVDCTSRQELLASISA